MCPEKANQLPTPTRPSPCLSAARLAAEDRAPPRAVSQAQELQESRPQVAARFRRLREPQESRPPRGGS